MMERPLPTDPEPEWSKYLAIKLNGEAEVILYDDSRADIITETEAIEVEWAKKWKEAPGQAILYGIVSNRKPSIILLTRNKPNEFKYYMRCLAVCAKADIMLRTFYTL